MLTDHMKPGKLYKVTATAGLEACDERDLHKGHREKSIIIPQGQIFLFVEVVNKEMNTFNKILVDEKVLVTYNGYLLREKVTELERPRNGRLPSTDRQPND